MPIVEYVTLIGRACVRLAVKLWLGDGVGAEVVETGVDLGLSALTGGVSNFMLEREFDELGGQVARRLARYCERAFPDVPENERLAAIDAIARTVDAATVNSSDIFGLDLDAGRLETLLQHAGAPVRRASLLGEAATRLYDSGLRQAALYIVYLTASLPQFHLKFAHESLRRQSRLANQVDRMMNTVMALTSAERVADLPPCQLPRDTIEFVDRQAQISMITTLLDVHQASSSPVVMISGKPGVGKTALAVRVAYAQRDRFPDGQLYASLRGMQNDPVLPGEVLEYFLRALGVPGDEIPDALEERAGVYRARLASRRVLVVLDDAANAAQVRQLLPASSSCAVVVTSRRPLTLTGNVTPVGLEILGDEDSMLLLAELAGRSRIFTDKEQSLRIARLCGNLPLALSLAGAHLRNRPQWRPSQFADRLDRARDQLATFGMVEVRASFAMSYEELPEDQRRAFRFAALLDAPSWCAWLLAELLGIDEETAEDLAERLVEAQLLEVFDPCDATGQVRYRFHDLIRVFARERVMQEESVEARRSAVLRAVRGCCAVAQHAFVVLPSRYLTTPDVPSRRSASLDRVIALARQDPTGWFDSERSTILACVDQANSFMDWQSVTGLVIALSQFLPISFGWDRRLPLLELAVSAAKRVGDRTGEARLLFWKSKAYAILGRPDDQIMALRRAYNIFTDLDDGHNGAHLLFELGMHYREKRDLKRAVAVLQAALAGFDQFDDENSKAMVACELGDIDKDLRRYPEAVLRYQECLKQVHRLGDRLGEARVLHSLGAVRSLQGRFEDALDHLRRSVRLFREARSDWWALLAERGVGDVYRQQGRLSEAADVLERVLAAARNTTHEPVTLLLLADTYRQQRRFDAAVGHFQESVELFGMRDHLMVWKGAAYKGLALCYEDMGDLARADQFWQRAEPILRDSGDHDGIADRIRR